MNNGPLDKENYLSDIKAIFGSTIYEYDIKQANINILYSYELISDYEYQWLQLAPKADRQWYIGKKAQMDILYNGKQKSTINATISEAVIKARRLLVDSNNVQLSEILRAAKDSIYVNRPLKLENTIFDLNNNNRPIIFTLRNVFDHYVRFDNGIVILIADNKDSFDADVKGIKDQFLPLHKEFLSAIINIIYIRAYNKAASLNEFNKLYEDYINLRCPINMYREFAPYSGFRYKNSLIGQELPMPTNLPESFDKNILDISYNLSMMRELYIMLYDN